MLLSMNWLKALVPYAYDPHRYIADMTMSGSKVETLQYLGAEIENVVVARVDSMQRHPDSDHLWICSVDIGRGKNIQIITGAQNLKSGDLVPAALDNSRLPGGVEIHKGKLRGLESDGMLCSYQELGLTEHDVPGACEHGILTLNDDPDAVVGRDIREVLGFDDWAVDFEITPNRPDCLSIIGLARESAVTYGLRYVPETPKVRGGAGRIEEVLKVRIDEPALCPRYTARVVKNVRIEPSPKWMRERLRACGVRPINNIVDITNYVMLEYGQPMHSFDYACLDGGEIVVRRAFDGEEMQTLDEKVHSLDTDMLVIADSHRAVGVAGVMGGANSEITDQTQMVVFESANFDATSIRLTSRRLGMRTEASGRFEKGLDTRNTFAAVERACELIEMLGAGEVCDGIVDIDNANYTPRMLTLEPERINRFLGVEVSREEMLHYFDLLGFGIDGDRLSVPSWRLDVEQFVDLAEEVARFHGYDRIPTTLYAGATRFNPNEAIDLDDSLRDLLCALGYTEAQTFSFIGPKSFDRIRLAPDSPLRRTARLRNPLSDEMSVMRTTMLPSILDVAARNANMKNKNARIYELGSIYTPVDGERLPKESKVLAMAAYGEVDFFSVKGIVEALALELGMGRLDFEACRDNPSYHPGRCAVISIGGDRLGVMGQIHPLVAENYNTSAQIYTAELDVPALLAHKGGLTQYKPLAKFPAVSRDIALVCDESVTAAGLEACIREGVGALLERVELFDVYRGAQLGENRKSVAYTITMRDRTRTLTDADADAAISRALALLEKNTGAVLRA
jgi:phenylalanyl-tRNA synthetase beta chain